MTRVLYTSTQDNARSEIESILLRRCANIDDNGVNILTFGSSNVGKSSYIGTIQSAVTGKRATPTKVRLEGESDHTTLALRQYSIITHLIKILDLWGWDLNTDNLMVKLFKQILEGMIPLGQFKSNPQAADRDVTRVVSAILFVITIDEVRVPGYLEKIKIFHDIAKDMGRAVVFAISKLDLIVDDTNINQFNTSVDPKKAENFLTISSPFKLCSDRIQLIVNRGAVCFPLVNYQNHQSKGVDKLDHLAGSIIEEILNQIENGHQLVDETEEVFDPFQYETPLIIQQQ